jgi:glucose/mannose transport system permease protein
MTSPRVARAGLYALLIAVALLFLAPLYAMVTASLPIEELRAGSILAFAEAPTLAAWSKASSAARVGASCVGLRPYFLNSTLMTVPAVAVSVAVGALNGYALTKWRFRGSELLFGLLLLGCFRAFQVILIPTARVLAGLGRFGSLVGLVLVHVAYGIPVTTLLFRNFYLGSHDEILDAARLDGAGFFSAFRHVLLPLSVPVTAVRRFSSSLASGTTSYSESCSRRPAAAPVTVALNNFAGASFGAREHNVDMAAALLTALPTLAVYVLSGRCFLRGLGAAP